MIYAYTRVSTVGQGKDGNSLAEQKEQILQMYPTAEVISEVYSGAKERPLFTDLLERAKSGDTVVVTKLDRFCRSTKEGLEYLERLTKNGVKVHILNLGLVEDTAMGKLIVTCLLAFAEFERQMILERTAAGKRVKKETDPNWHEGRKKMEVPSDIGKYIAMCEDGEISVKEACEELGISRSYWYSYRKNVA